MITAQEMLRFYPYMNEKNKPFFKLFANYQNSMRDKCRLKLNKEIRKGVLKMQMCFYKIS